MEGLEISEIMLSQCRAIIDFRIDSNTYLKKYLATEKVLKSLNNKTIESLSISVQNFGAYSLCNYINYVDEESDGIPFLMTENVRNNFIDWNIRKYVDLESHDLLYKSHCKKNQVLVTMAGEYLGRVAVYDKSFECSSNQAIAKVTLHDESKAFIYSTFLNSIYGQNQINRFKTTTGQPNINMSLIKNLIIPDFSDDLVKKINILMRGFNNKKNISNANYQEAEDLLLKTLGIGNFEASSDPINVKSFKDSFEAVGRLDAEYFQPKYEDYYNLITSDNYTLIKSEFDQVKDVIDRTLEEYNYIEIGDINVGTGIALPHKVLLDDLPANGKIKAKKGDLLISKVRPYRGAISIINDDVENLVVSGAFTVLRSKPNSYFNIEVLKVLLRTPIYKDWLLQFNVGTSYPVIKDEDILDLPIPIINKDIQEKIASLIQESLEFKKDSEYLLEVAKIAIEIAIEVNENAAITLINQNI